MGSHRLLIFFTAGAGGGFSKKRLLNLGVALLKALKQESGQDPTPLATSPLFDTYVFAISVPMSAAEFGKALMKRLGDPFFFSEDSDHADKLIITEILDEKYFATSAVVKTLLGWKHGRLPK
jgi:hypothetical protein